MSFQQLVCSLEVLMMQEQLIKNSLKQQQSPDTRIEWVWWPHNSTGIAQEECLWLITPDQEWTLVILLPLWFLQFLEPLLIGREWSCQIPRYTHLWREYSQLALFLGMFQAVSLYITAAVSRTPKSWYTCWKMAPQRTLLRDFLKLLQWRWLIFCPSSQKTHVTCHYWVNLVHK